jgi:hypothetical protein
MWQRTITPPGSASINTLYPRDGTGHNEGHWPKIDHLEIGSKLTHCQAESSASAKVNIAVVGPRSDVFLTTRCRIARRLRWALTTLSSAQPSCQEPSEGLAQGGQGGTRECHPAVFVSRRQRHCRRQSRVLGVAPTEFGEAPAPEIGLPLVLAWDSMQPWPSHERRLRLAIQQ